MGMMKEFKEFALKGSLIDLAVALVLGIAFGALVKSFVDDIIMPIVGFFLGGKDFSNLYIVLKDGDGLAGGESLSAAREAGAVVIAYGQFINVLITFLIVAFVIFMIVKGVNRAKKMQEAQPQETPTSRPCPECLSEIPKAATRCKACGAQVGQAA